MSRRVISAPLDVRCVLDPPKGHSYYPKIIMLQLQICHHSYLNVSYKTKLIQILETKPVNSLSQSTRSRTLSYPVSIMLQSFTENSAIPLQTENVKTNNNILGHHLVSRLIIYTPSDV